jgi:transposase-like protein
MDRVGEIISRVERRRRWTAEQKVKVLTEAFEPGATISAVADRNGISRSQLYAWMKRARKGDIPGISLNSPQKPLFAPVRIAPTSPTLPMPAVTTSPVACRQRRPSAIEIALTNGRVVRAEEGIEPAWLANLVAALDGCRS